MDEFSLANNMDEAALTVTEAESAQGSGAWLAMRQKRIGASDAPIILGVSPWSTPYKLWREKMGLNSKERDPNKSAGFAIDRGNRWEPIARARYEAHNGFIDMPPTVLIHKEHDFLMASLDGYNEQEKLVLEIKIPGREVMEAAKNGTVHPKYTPQLEHQMLVSQATRVHFYCCSVASKNGKEQIIDDALVEYRSNPELRELLIPKLHQFWGYMRRNEPPPLTERDCLDLSDPVALELFDRIGCLELEMDKLAIEQDRLDSAKPDESGIKEWKEKIREIGVRLNHLELEQNRLKKEALCFLTHPRVRADWVELRQNKRFPNSWSVKIHAD